MDSDRPDAAADRVRGALALTAWTATLITLLAIAHAVGGGRLTAPPLLEPGAVGAWFDARSEVEAVMAVLRLVVIALGWYLLGVTVVGTAARATRSVRWVRITDLVAVPVVRRLLHGALGLGLATVAVTWATPGTASAVHPAGGPDATVVAHESPGGLASAGGHASAGGPGPPDIPGSPRGHLDPGSPRETAEPRQRLPVDGPANLPGALPSGGDLPDGGSGSATAATQEAEGRVWLIASGEHLWGVAAQTLKTHWGRGPSDPEVHAYWMRLIEENTAALPDPGNPDLVTPGLEIALPPVPDEPGR